MNLLPWKCLLEDPTTRSSVKFLTTSFPAPPHRPPLATERRAAPASRTASSTGTSSPITGRGSRGPTGSETCTHRSACRGSPAGAATARARSPVAATSMLRRCPRRRPVTLTPSATSTTSGASFPRLRRGSQAPPGRAGRSRRRRATSCSSRSRCVSRRMPRARMIPISSIRCRTMGPCGSRHRRRRFRIGFGYVDLVPLCFHLDWIVVGNLVMDFT